MTNKWVSIGMLFLLGCLSFPLQGTTQSLQERIDCIETKIEQVRSYPSIRMKVRIEQINLSEEQSSAKLQEGEMIYFSNKVSFNGTIFDADTLEECKKRKDESNEEILLRAIFVTGQRYIQSGDIHADDVVSFSDSTDVFSSESLYALFLLQRNLRSCEEFYAKRINLASIMPTRIVLSDNKTIDRYEIRGPNSDAADELFRLDFSADGKNPLPTCMALGIFLKENNKSFWNWSLTLQLDDQSPLGYSEYEYSTYSVTDGSIKNKQNFLENPDSFLKRNLFSHVTILQTPVVNGAVFPEEFSFRIPKGKALIVHNENPGSEPQRIVSEKDRIFTP